MNYEVVQPRSRSSKVIFLEDMKPGEIGEVIEWQYGADLAPCFVVCGGALSDEWSVTALGDRRYWTLRDKEAGEARQRVRLLAPGEAILIRGKE